MEEISYYATILCLILLLVSFYWFIRNDHLTKRIAREDICNDDLAVILVCNSSHKMGFSGSLKEAFELEKFGVYLAQEVGDSNCRLTFGANEINGFNLEFNKTDQLVNYFEAQLESRGQKLHALVSICAACPEHLPDINKNRGRAKGFSREICQGCILHPLRGLSTLLSPAIVRDAARVIHVRDALSPESANGLEVAANLCKLVRSLGCGISNYLCSAPTRMITGGRKRWNVNDVKIQPDARDCDPSVAAAGTMGSLIKFMAANLNKIGINSTRTGNEFGPTGHNNGYGDKSRDGPAIKVSSARSSTRTTATKLDNDTQGLLGESEQFDLLDARSVAEIVSLVVRVNPARRKIVK